MKEFLENAPKIITESAKSPLGICALLILAISLLAWMFFGGSSEEIKAGIFILVILSFLFLSIASFDYVRSEKQQDNLPPEPEKAEEIIINSPATVENENIEWTHYTNPHEKHTLSLAEVDILKALRGKPDIRWNRELLISKASGNSSSTKESLSIALDSLVDKEYLLINNENKYHVLPLCIDYYRSTDDREVHEIDEADYWDGT